MKFYVYVYRHNDALVYIGKGSGCRAIAHFRRHKCRSKSPFQNFINSVNLSDITIETFRVDTEKSALALEATLIAKTKPRFNVFPGGKQPPNQREKKFKGRKPPITKGEKRERWSATKKEAHRRLMKDVMKSPLIREKISNSKIGRVGNKHTEESKAKISAAHKGIKSRNKSKSKLGKLNPVIGWKWFNDGNSQRLFHPDFAPPDWSAGKLKKEKKHAE